ncbi:hypothetical protein HPP92_013709 [Vanilla planifolia]|uniref:3'-5' exonuclease domain-containing protein n=1 Tax=Vanilla planifolia TaxID=51239 RepID=A0A835V087_VANPL|nr:hypothetical protein HPP92_013709 [Vanilla planifolia]
MIWNDRFKLEVVIACVAISFATLLLTSGIYRRWRRRRSGASLVLGPGESLAATLSKEKVFAVDTEQHSIRSFLGFTALMQISTQKEDFLVDTIALHDVMGILRPVFANPFICKTAEHS